MPLSHVCVWDADIGYKRISLESACKMYPNGASAKSGYFVCELCAQNVLLTAPGVNVRHFRHDPSSPNKECDERQAHFDPLYGRRLRNLNSHLMPLRITVAKESFALQMGFFCPPDSEARCDKIRITTNSGKAYEYSFERIERGGTTYLNIGETPSREYNLEYINAAADLVKFWPSKVPGISSSGYQQHVGPVFGIDECRAAKEQALNAGEDKMDKHWISLCKVNRPDKNRDIWMLRLADAVGGVLVAPYFDKQKEQIHDNRLFVFCDDGPTEPGRIGFWEWEEFESEPGRWKTTSTYMEQASPVEVIVLDEVSNIEGVIMSLKSGLKIPSYAHGKIIFAAKNDTGFEGVLCDTGESLLRQRNPELVALRDDIYTLPYYKLNKSDIFEWKYEWESRKIYKYISLREPQKRIPIYPISETIKNIFLSSMGWPIFKAQAILKNDYLKFREALASIPKESILERVADTYGISIQEAQTYVDEFLQMVEKYMTVEDVDSAVITRILSKHGGLWQKCNDIAYNKWIADHANEVNTAQEELAALQHKVAQAENDVSSAKEKHGDILREVAEAQDDLCRLQAEIARYKILEKETVAAIREKIAGAQKNVAGFIADLSILLPQATSNESGWKYRHISAVYPEDEVGVSKDWKDELNELSQNLSYSLNVEPDLATMLAAFLYSAHIHNAPILIAGPCGQDIANALSVSLYADNAGQLMFGEQFDCDIADAVNNVNEHIVAAQNMFGKGWGDIIPQMLANSRKHIVWTHPYVEDLAIEPQGLYNYMLPVISECFVGTVSALEPYAGKRSEDFIGYVPKDTHPLRIAAFKKLGISKALLRQLSRVISDAKVMVDSPERAKDMEMLFGVMPICVLTGQLDVMREVLEAESGISSAVKAEAERYLKDE